MKNSERTVLFSLLWPVVVRRYSIDIISLPPGRYDCDSKCVNFKHNFEIGILNFQRKISQGWMPGDHIDSKCDMTLFENLYNG